MTPLSLIQQSYEKIIEALQIQFAQAQHLHAARPFTLVDYKSPDNRFIFLRQGKITVNIEATGQQLILQPGDVFFLPKDTLAYINYGPVQGATLTQEQFLAYQGQYLQQVDGLSPTSSGELFSYVSFEARVYDAIDFFEFVKLPPCIINNTHFHALIEALLAEAHGQSIAHRALLEVQTKYLVILLMRYLEEQQVFRSHLAIKINALTDIRLVKLINYISQNLHTKLSNKALAGASELSKDYVGQYFKHITQMKLQNYVSLLRLQKALHLLRNTNMKIQDISKTVGYNDVSYFSRKFGELCGTTARKARSQGKYNYEKVSLEATLP